MWVRLGFDLSRSSRLVATSGRTSVREMRKIFQNQLCGGPLDFVQSNLVEMLCVLAAAVARAGADCAKNTPRLIQIIDSRRGAR